MIIYIIISFICVISLILLYSTIRVSNGYKKIYRKNKKFEILPNKNENNVFIYWDGYKYKLIQILHKLIYLHSNNEKKYKVYFINSNNLYNYIDYIPSFFDKMKINHKSDYIRYKLICEYGGIWLDSDTIVMSDLSSLFEVIKNKDGFFIKENNKILCSGVFGSKSGTELLNKIVFEMDRILSRKKHNLNWCDIGPKLLTDIYKKHKYLFSNYTIYDGLDNMYPVNWDNCVSEFLEKPYNNYENLIRQFQPLIIIVNSVYKKLDNMSIDQIINSNMPINYFLNNSFKSVNFQTKFKLNKTFNCLIATKGRKSLQRMLNSLLPQLTEDDCVTIVFDGHSSIPYFDLSLGKCKINQYFEPVALGYWGHGVRNKYASLLEKRDFVLHADDDDIYVHNAFYYLRNICNDTKILYITLVKSSSGIYGKKIEEGKLGTPCGVIPYEYNKKAEFLLRRGGDGAFYEKLAYLYPNNIVSLDKIIYIVRDG